MVGWHPSKEVLVSASYDDTVRTWEADEDDWSPAQILDTHTSTVWAFSFNQSGEWMATAGDDATIRLWRDANGSSGNTTKYEEEGVLRGFHSRAILSIDWLCGLDILASAVSLSLSFSLSLSCVASRTRSHVRYCSKWSCLMLRQLVVSHTLSASLYLKFYWNSYYLRCTTVLASSTHKRECVQARARATARARERERK